jgi:hypothetical protein
MVQLNRVYQIVERIVYVRRAYTRVVKGETNLPT